MSELREVLLALGDALRERRGLYDRDDVGDPLLPEALDRDLDRTFVPDDQRRGDQDRGEITVEPVLLRAGVRRGEVGQRDLAVPLHHEVPGIEVPVDHPGFVQLEHGPPRRLGAWRR